MFISNFARFAKSHFDLTHWVSVLVLLAPLALKAEVMTLEQGRIEPSPPAQVRALMQLELLLLAGSGWQQAEIAPLLTQLGRIFGQCGVGLQRVDWRVLQVPEALLDFSTPAAQRLLDQVAVARPAAILLRDTRQQPAFDAEAIGRGNSRSRPTLRDTVWLTRALPHPDIGLAHELAHVLMNSGAHPERPGNLMQARSAPGNTRLDADQCEALVGNGLVNGLLQRGD